MKMQLLSTEQGILADLAVTLLSAGNPLVSVGRQEFNLSQFTLLPVFA